MEKKWYCFYGRSRAESWTQRRRVWIFAVKKYEKLIQMKEYTMYFRNEKILFFYWIMLKSGRQARKRWRWWGRNYEFISVRKGNVRLSDNSFVSLSKFLDVKLLLKYILISLYISLFLLCQKLHLILWNGSF